MSMGSRLLREEEADLLLWILIAATLVALLGMRIASSPPFALIGCLFASWADRCANGPELVP